MTIDPSETITRPDGSEIAFGKLKPRDQLAHELVLKLMPHANDLRRSLTAFKADAISQLMAHRDMMMQDYKVAVGGTGGNITLKSADGRFAVKYTVQKAIEFGPELEAAKGHIFDCLNDWAEGASDELRQIVTRVFALNSKGRIDTQGILNLRNLDINDERWKEAMTAIDDAIRRDRASTYINFFEIDPTTGLETRLPLDIAKL